MRPWSHRSIILSRLASKLRIEKLWELASDFEPLKIFYHERSILTISMHSWKRTSGISTFHAFKSFLISYQRINIFSSFTRRRFFTLWAAHNILDLRCLWRHENSLDETFQNGKKCRTNWQEVLLKRMFVWHGEKVERFCENHWRNRTAEITRLEARTKWWW